MLAKPSNVKFLNVNTANGFIVSDLMTTSTDQVITSDTYIDMILASAVNTRILNNMRHFADNVVLIGGDAVIECTI